MYYCRHIAAHSGHRQRKENHKYWQLTVQATHVREPRKRHEQSDGALGVKQVGFHAVHDPSQALIRALRGVEEGLIGGNGDDDKLGGVSNARRG